MKSLDIKDFYCDCKVCKDRDKSLEIAKKYLKDKNISNDLEPLFKYVDVCYPICKFPKVVDYYVKNGKKYDMSLVSQLDSDKSILFTSYFIRDFNVIREIKNYSSQCLALDLGQIMYGNDIAAFDSYSNVYLSTVNQRSFVSFKVSSYFDDKNKGVIRFMFDNSVKFSDRQVSIFLKLKQNGLWCDSTHLGLFLKTNVESVEENKCYGSADKSLKILKRYRYIVKVELWSEYDKSKYDYSPIIEEGYFKIVFGNYGRDSDFMRSELSYRSPPCFRGVTFFDMLRRFYYADSNQEVEKKKILRDGYWFNSIVSNLVGYDLDYVNGGLYFNHDNVCDDNGCIHGPKSHLTVDNTKYLSSMQGYSVGFGNAIRVKDLLPICGNCFKKRMLGFVQYILDSSNSLDSRIKMYCTEKEQEWRRKYVLFGDGRLESKSYLRETDAIQHIYNYCDVSSFIYQGKIGGFRDVGYRVLYDLRVGGSYKPLVVHCFENSVLMLEIKNSKSHSPFLGDVKLEDYSVIDNADEGVSLFKLEQCIDVESDCSVSSSTSVISDGSIIVNVKSNSVISDSESFGSDITSVVEYMDEKDKEADIPYSSSSLDFVQEKLMSTLYKKYSGIGAEFVSKKVSIESDNVVVDPGGICVGNGLMGLDNLLLSSKVVVEYSSIMGISFVSIFGNDLYWSYLDFKNGKPIHVDFTKMKRRWWSEINLKNLLSLIDRDETILTFLRFLFLMLRGYCYCIFDRGK